MWWEVGVVWCLFGWRGSNIMDDDKVIVIWKGIGFLELGFEVLELIFEYSGFILLIKLFELVEMSFSWFYKYLVSLIKFGYVL